MPDNKTDNKATVTLYLATEKFRASYE